MRIWAFGFILFFGSVEFYQWLKAMEIPLPVYIGMGVLLAIASNARRSPPYLESNADPLAKPTIPKPVSQEIPNTQQTRDSISFKIDP
ncbi:MULTISPECIES: hypothetical protein [Spirulina sp. CCY15215]|uniref:hypothetical protein n=1 Tax=Spirulina sp. CCY15215 TaxID=2767591 RepID=UPI0019509BA4|nr:hypothetical protein [Spirulina major]